MGNDLVKKSVLVLWDYTIGKYADFVDKWEMSAWLMNSTR